MPSVEIKQNHINRSIKIIEGRIRGGEKQRENIKQKTITNMVDINPTIKLVTLNVNGLNMPINQLRDRCYQRR